MKKNKQLKVTDLRVGDKVRVKRAEKVLGREIPMYLCTSLSC